MSYNLIVTCIDFGQYERNVIVESDLSVLHSFDGCRSELEEAYLSTNSKLRQLDFTDQGMSFHIKLVNQMISLEAWHRWPAIRHILSVDQVLPSKLPPRRGNSK